MFLAVLRSSGLYWPVHFILTALVIRSMNAPFYAGVVRSSKIWHIQWSLGTLCCYSDRMERMGYTPYTVKTTRAHAVLKKVLGGI